jgi:hypothetical protein
MQANIHVSRSMFRAYDIGGVCDNGILLISRDGAERLARTAERYAARTAQPEARKRVDDFAASTRGAGGFGHSGSA